MSIKQLSLLLILFLGLNGLQAQDDENLTYSNELARACVTKADKFVRNENYPAALRWMNKAIKRNPRQAELYYNRGVIYRLTGKFEQALSDFNMTIELRPDIGRAYLNKGMTQHELGQYEEAVASYSIAADSLKQVADIYALRAKALAKTGRHADAAISYQQALALKGDKASWHLERAVELRKTGAYAAAISSANKALSADSTMKDAWLIRGRAQLEQGLPYEALLDAKRAETENADDVEIRILKGDVHLAMGHINTAAELYEGAISSNPDDAEGFYRRGRLHLMQSKNRQAYRDLLQSVRLDSNVASYHVALGESLERLDDFEGAEKHFDKAYKIDPESRLVARSRGTFRARIGDFDGALADLDFLVKSRPTDTATLRIRADVRKDAGQLKASIEDLNRVMQTDSSQARDWAALGYTYCLLGDFKKSYSCLQKAKRVEPTLGIIYTYLGAHAILSESVVEAGAHLDRAIQLMPDYALSYFWRATYRKLEGKDDEACDDISLAKKLGLTEAHMPQPAPESCQ
ncbi:MAG: tetratricopeptide repeat protein [Bacteroidia bacterium]